MSLRHHCVLSEALVDAIRDARPICTFYGTKKGCRKGVKCPLRHMDNTEADLRLPYVSRSITKAGEEVVMLRPPLLH